MVLSSGVDTGVENDSDESTVMSHLTKSYNEPDTSKSIDVTPRSQKRNCFNALFSCFGYFQKTYCAFLPRRYLIVILLFFGTMIAMCLRVNLSVTIIVMASDKSAEAPNGNRTDPYKEDTEFDWDSKTQGIVLGGFFYGYLFLQLAAGYLSARFGGYILFGAGSLTNGILALLSPLAARLHVYAFFAIRFLQGFSQGFIIPTMYTVLSKWVPPHERTKLSTASMSGISGGVVLGISLSGILIDKYGWDVMYYIQGIICILWCLLWFLLASESPDSDPGITDQEHEYINNSFATQHGSQGAEVRKVPWKKIFTSVPVWALVLTHFCQNWGYYTLSIELPSYLVKVLHYDIKDSGLLAAAPYLGFMLIGMLSGRIADRLRLHYLSTTTVRKLAIVLGFAIQGTFLIIVGFIEDRTIVAVGFILSSTFGGIAIACFPVNQLDLAPRYASILFGITNSIATLPGSLSPLLVGFVVKEQTREDWRTVFLVAASFFYLGIAIFTIFGTGEKQSWADYGLQAQDDEEGTQIFT